VLGKKRRGRRGEALILSVWGEKENTTGSNLLGGRKGKGNQERATEEVGKKTSRVEFPKKRKGEK